MEALEKIWFLVPNWKWIVLITSVSGAWFLRPLFWSFFKKVKQIPKSWPHTKDNFWEHLLNSELERPLSGLFMVFIWKASLDALDFPAGAYTYFHRVLQVCLAFYLIFLFLLAVDALAVLLGRWARSSVASLDNQLMVFATRSLKIIVVILGVLALLQNMGVNVISLLAGLSIGGLALALAAQETFANLFGSITIFFDQPFKVGDQIKVADVEGIVVDIGFRSTRIRTGYNSIVSIPNSVVAKEKIDNLGERPARRVRTFLNLTYDTTPEKMAQFCDTLEAFLINDPAIEDTTVQVYFTTYSASSMDVQVIYHIKTTDPNLELEITEKVNIEAWRIAKQVGVEFAFPTQTVYYRNVNP